MRLAAALALLLAAHVAKAATIHVPGDQPTIQAGIDAAAAGDTVLVGCGTYFESGLDLPFDVHLRSATGNPSCVTIDAQAEGRVLVSGASTIAGLTLTGGTAFGQGSSGWGGIVFCYFGLTTIEDCVLSDGEAYYGGALVSHLGASVRMRDCVISNSRAYGGGALLINLASLELERCRLRWNFANSEGGGVLARGSSLVVSEGEFTHNTAYRGAAVSFDQGGPFEIRGTTISANKTPGGGALHGFYVDPFVIEDCAFLDNVGGAVLDNYSDVSVVDCRFEGNRAHSGAALQLVTNEELPSIQGSVFLDNVAEGGVGGACYIWGEAEIMECVFARNRAAGPCLGGGALWLRDGWSTVVSGSTFWGNETCSDGVGASAVHVDDGWNTTMSHNILWGATSDPPISCAGSTVLHLSCNDISGGFDGDWTTCTSEPPEATGNFTADPLFCDPDDANFTLSSQSPCLPGNHSDGADCGLIGAYGEGCGPVSVEQESWAGIKERYRSGHRRADP